MRGLTLMPGMVLRLWLEEQACEVPLPILATTETSFSVDAPPGLEYYPGKRLLCRYYADGGIWKFTVAVLSTLRDADTCKLNVTQPASFEHTQKRNDVRVDVALPASIILNGLRMQGQTFDLSAGGIRMSLKKPTLCDLRNGAEGVVEVTLEEKAPPLQVTARVVRLIEREKHVELGLAFQRMPDADRSRIVRRVFAEQRRRIR